MEWYLAALRKYAVFSGRARRKEYWMFALVNTLVMIGLAVVGGVFGDEAGLGGLVLYLLYVAATLIPGLAVSVRRLHDTGRSGWWLLISVVPIVGPIVLLVFTVQDGEPGDNVFGANPKGSYAGGAFA
jgi:uncharacterized membrane protein YhaH (DUF805 family)